MTQPTISYGHVWTHDCDSLTDWARVAGAPDLAGATLAVGNNDYLDLSCSGAAVAGQSCYWNYPDETLAPELAIDTTINQKFLIRYKTSVASAGLGLAVQAVYHGGNLSWLLGSNVAPAYSDSWKCQAFSFPTGAGYTVLDHIRLYAYCQTNGANNIRVDFLLACQGIFTWPFVSDGIDLDDYNNRPRLKPPGKVGNTTQYLGADDSELRVAGDIDTTGVDVAGVPQVNQGWHGRWTTKDAETFYQVLHYGFSEPWNWFTSDVASLKVTVDHFKIRQAKSNDNLLSYILDMHEYRLGSAHVETSLERFGIWP